MIEVNVKEFETCRPALNMSGYRGGPEVPGPRCDRREGPEAELNSSRCRFYDGLAIIRFGVWSAHC